MIKSDFKSLEVYVQAALTNCQSLLEDLRGGLDLHCKMLAAVEQLPYEQVIKKCATDKLWKAKRSGVKNVTFQLAYGAGASAIVATTGLSLEVVESIIAERARVYPEIQSYFDSLLAAISQNSRPAGKPQPHPDVPGKWLHLSEGFSRTPDGKKYSYRQSPSPLWAVRRGVFASFKPPEVKNYEVQGTGAEIMKAACALVLAALYSRSDLAGKVLLVNTVHDEVCLDSHPDCVEDAQALLHACMEAASEFFTVLTGWQLPIQIPSETSVSSSLKDDGTPLTMNEGKLVRARTFVRALANLG
jgi:DNA polymerase I